MSQIYSVSSTTVSYEPACDPESRTTSKNLLSLAHSDMWKQLRDIFLIVAEIADLWEDLSHEHPVFCERNVHIQDSLNFSWPQIRWNICNTLQMWPESPS